jgi:hypothetical protein
VPAAASARPPPAVIAGYGANVVLAARSTDDIERIAAEIGDKAMAVSCDVSRYQDVQTAVATAKERFGGLDILVNNAGVIDPIARIEDSDPDIWDQVVDINLKGVYHGLRATIPVMKQQGGGVIINISSGAATGAIEGWSHYCATKAAVLSLTRCAHMPKTRRQYPCGRPFARHRGNRNAALDQGLRRQSGQPAGLVQPHLARMGRRSNRLAHHGRGAPI